MSGVGRAGPWRWQFSWVHGEWEQVDGGRAGPGFGLKRREMAAGGRMEDVSVRKWGADGPGIPFFLSWVHWAETAGGNHS